MIKTVQKSICGLTKSDDKRSDDLAPTDEDEEDDDCVYVSPDESENGIYSERFFK